MGGRAANGAVQSDERARGEPACVCRAAELWESGPAPLPGQLTGKTAAFHPKNEHFEVKSYFSTNFLKFDYFI